MTPAPPAKGARRPVAAQRLADPFRSNPVLAGAALDEGRSRRPLVIASVAIHALLIVAVLVLPALLPEREKEPEPIRVVFYTPDAKPKPVAPPKLPEPEPVEIARAEPPPRLAPPKPEPAPPPRARNVPRRIVPEPTPPAPAPTKPRPQVRTEVFAESRTAKAESAPPRKTRSAGFGRVEAAAPPRPQARSTFASVGSFASADEGDAPAPSKREQDAVARTGFAGEVADVRPSNGRSTGEVTRTGFTGEVAQATPAVQRSSGSVQQGGFGEVAEAARPSAPRKRAVETPDTPVEILSKARPAYTERARELRIEGEVVLEVTFLASRTLRVHRVLDSLGHGLDEAAIEAASKIEFTPARRNGRPVDHTATLRVVFRLA